MGAIQIFDLSIRKFIRSARRIDIW